MHGEPVPESIGEGADDAIERAAVPVQVLWGTMVVGVVMVGGAVLATGPSFYCGKVEAGSFAELECYLEYVSSR